MELILNLNQIGNLIINSITNYITFYAVGFIFGVNDHKQLHVIGIVGLIIGCISKN